MTIKTWQQRFAEYPMATSDIAKLAEIDELRLEVAALKLEKRDIDFAYMEGFEAAKHEARDAYHAEIDDLKRLLAQALEQNTLLDKKLAEYEKREPAAIVKTINGIWLAYMEKRLPDGTPLYAAPVVDKDQASW